MVPVMGISLTFIFIHANHDNPSVLNDGNMSDMISIFAGSVGIVVVFNGVMYFMTSFISRTIRVVRN